MTKTDLIDVFNDTVAQTTYKYPIANVKTVFYHGDLVVAPEKRTEVTVVRSGTVSAGYRYADAMRVAILNFADATSCGGLVTEGATAQEESICRCTNLYSVLRQRACDEEFYLPNLADYSARRRAHEKACALYTNNVIYADGVTVFKDDVTYKNIEPRQLAVITCPAPSSRLPQTDAFELYVKRIKQILFSAIRNGADCIVLGAWGCGAFGQDPRVVAQAFREVIRVWGGHFKKVVFAFRDCDDEVLKIFTDAFKQTNHKLEVAYE